MGWVSGVGGWGGDKAVVYRFRRGVVGWVGGEVGGEVTGLAVVYRFRRGVGEWGVGGEVTRRWYICSDEGWLGGWVRSQGGGISVQTRGDGERDSKLIWSSLNQTGGVGMR